MAKHGITRKLLHWYRRHGRDLPWRKTHDPYKILVSEVMLQQTQVRRVIPYYDTWLHAFPTWESLAEASNADVIRAWSGLGYNRRSLVLRDIAMVVVKRGVPSTLEGWQALRGIGPYTAAAVMSICFEGKVLPIDTNVRRVLGRVFLKQLFPDPKRDNELAKIAVAQFNRSVKLCDVTQALFDLANTHCTKMPSCSICPLRDVCRSSKSFLSGNVVAPKSMIKKANERVHRNKRYPDRIYRGRILQAVQELTSLPIAQLGPIVDATFDPQLDKMWLMDMVSRLEKDGMVRVKKNSITLYA